MIIIALRTDKPEAEIALYSDEVCLEREVWQAHRQLAETIHIKLDKLMSRHQLKLNCIEGVVCFLGPGSFTGLRIGLSVGNALAYGYNVPIAGGQGDKWLADGVKRLLSGQNDLQLIPNYGADPHITNQKK